MHIEKHKNRSHTCHENSSVRVMFIKDTSKRITIKRLVVMLMSLTVQRRQ